MKEWFLWVLFVESGYLFLNIIVYDFNDWYVKYWCVLCYIFNYFIVIFDVMICYGSYNLLNFLY